MSFEKNDYFAVFFDGKFRTLQQFIGFLKFFDSLYLYIDYILIYRRDAIIPTSIQLSSVIEIFESAQQHNYSFRDSKRWKTTICDISGHLEDIMDNPVKALEEFYELVLDNNEYKVTFNMPANALNWDYYAPVDEHIKRDLRVDVRSSKIVPNTECSWFIYSDVANPNSPDIASDDAIEEHCIRKFKDSHFDKFYIGCDYDAYVGILWGRLGLLAEPSGRYEVYDIVYCIVGDLENDDFKNNLMSVLPDITENTADELVRMCREEVEKH